MDRTGLVEELLSFGRPVSDVLADLVAYGWDSDEPIAELKPSHLRNTLSLFMGAKLSAAQVEEWANAIECREDIEYEASSPQGEAVFELANPELTAPLDPARAEWLLRGLSVRS